MTRDNYSFSFGKGTFDDYCVYTVRPNGKLWFAKDYEYLYWIQQLSKTRYGKDRVYNDFLRIYYEVSYDYDFESAYEVIKEVSDTYPRSAKTEHWWTIFYMTMVAEERKENSILGKMIKRLGVYNVIYDGYTPKCTAEYMKNKDVDYLYKKMKKRGIID